MQAAARRFRPSQLHALSRACSSTAPLLSDERIRADGTGARWLQFVPACSAGLCLGTYAAVPGVLGPEICRAQGVVAAAASDFAAGPLLTFATAMPLVAGVCAATLAPRMGSLGFRRLAFGASVSYPLGTFLLPAAAVYANSLTAFGASYALLGGLGLFAGYPQVPPFLISWFPEYKGTSMSIYFLFFGSGQLLAAKLAPPLLAHFRTPPTRLGGADEVATTLSVAGQPVATVDGAQVEVVVASARELAAGGFAGLQDGVFLLGTGSNGAAAVETIGIPEKNYYR